ncbi:MAG: TonB family protein [Bacteroidetes bacterium]|nr:TonB family protein [Bacteroidota bacterium]
MTLTLALLQSSLWLTAGWIGYRFLLRDTRHFALNRAYLWLVMGGALLLPLFSAALSGLFPQTTVQTPALWLAAVTTGPEASSAQPNTLNWFGLLYAGGMALVLLRLFRNLWRIGTILRQATPMLVNGHQVRLNPNSDQAGSYSFMRSIVLDAALLRHAEARNRVLAHELAHTRQWHSLDALAAELLCALFWFNPFCWVLRRSVAENNEFLADQAALQQQPGVRAYAELLLRGNGPSPEKNTRHAQPALGLLQPFHTSQTKRRLLMLAKNTPSRIAFLPYAGTLLMLLTVLGLSVSAQQVTRTGHNIPKVTQAPEESQQADHAQTDKLQEAEKNPEVMPKFPGGMDGMIRYLSKELKYPASAKKEGISGKTIVQFVVDSDGSIRDVTVLKGFNADCDAEAVRVVRAMPNWKAGQKEDKAVATQLVLPIQFALE